MESDMQQVGLAIAQSRTTKGTTSTGAFSPITEDLLFRLQRRIGLIPSTGLGLARRALFWSLVAWLPIALWAWYSGSIAGPNGDAALSSHFNLHVQCLIAIPTFILSQGIAQVVFARVISLLPSSGVVPPSEQPRLDEMLVGLARLADTARPWIIIAAVVLSVTLVSVAVRPPHEIGWAVNEGRLGFGGWWFLLVARPIYLGLLLAWLWRLILLCLLLFRMRRLNLDLVATHPDRLGGMSFIELLPAAFTPVVFAISAVFAARQAHDAIFHELSAAAMRMHMIAFLILVLILFGTPYLALAPALARAKRKAVVAYGRLIGEHDRLVWRRWVEGEEVTDDALLNAPELGPVADTVSLYEAVRAMRTVPIGRKTLIYLLGPALPPLLAAMSIKVPVKHVLLAVLKAIV